MAHFLFRKPNCATYVEEVDWYVCVRVCVCACILIELLVMPSNLSGGSGGEQESRTSSRVHIFHPLYNYAPRLGISHPGYEEQVKKLSA